MKRTLSIALCLLFIATMVFAQQGDQQIGDQQIGDQAMNEGFHLDLVNILIGLVVGGIAGFFVGKNKA